ncbi:uncharacterized protein si:ch211-51h9.7 isoform X2 [Notolabrus celidotus]|uniref:uncharacterized protein si:ch211-51h9.7 isoform X2 n=1 Tax=Notolabrus celidotus TaxID=1203425 RepID=UPI00148F4914|nr:uncharacterized protein si:ch211-51h9.7 isoform X2 [Notolabrus celidotus]
MRSKLSARQLLQHLHRLLVHFLVLCAPVLYRPGEACAAGAQDGGSSPEVVLLCRACGHELGTGTSIHSVPSRLALSSRNQTLIGGRRVHIQLFENPHGHQFEVITFRTADVSLHWPADKHFSWFPGFSWTLSTCPRLGVPARHLARHHHKDQV